MRSITSLFLILPLFFTACHKDIQSQTEIYSNAFETKDLMDIEGGILNTYNGQNLVGFYNNDRFTLKLKDLDKHSLILIKFDLYIHDSWGGNNTGTKDNTDGPDIWQLKVDDETVINTTFSNSRCLATYCLQQSYPKNYPFHYDPGAASVRTDLPGVCKLVGDPNGTSLYRIEKIFNHTGKDLKLEFKDLLQQNNTFDNLCDESWSLDNLSVSILTL
jgi:hypothetical protein